MISALLEDRPEDLLEAWTAFRESGRGARKRLEGGLALLPEDLRGRLEDLLASGTKLDSTPLP